MAKEQVRAERRPLRVFSFWKDMDELRKNRIIGFCGLLMAALALFTLLSCVSYLFTWREDMSLLQDPGRMALSEPVHNWGGKWGASWSALLVYRWFGLGAFALIVLMVILAARMLGRKSVSLVKSVLLTVTGALLASFILAFVSRVSGQEYWFGGGLGGRFGDFAIASTANLIGMPLTAVLLLLLFLLWFVFANSRFSDWFSGIGLPTNPETAQAPVAPAMTAPVEKTEMPDIEEDVAAAEPEPVQPAAKPGGFTWAEVKMETSAGTQVVTPAPAAEPAPEADFAEEMDFDTFLYRLRHGSLTLSAMAFQDAMNLNIERLHRCSLHVYDRGKIKPFCAKYLTTTE